MVALGDFNAKSKSWHTNYFLTFIFGFHQIINNPTHILNNSSSCIDLIFTTQPNLAMESGARFSVHADCITNYHLWSLI